MPASAEWYLDGATLRWKDGDCGDAVIADSSGTGKKQQLELARLGGDAAYTYAARALPGCKERKTFSSDDYTRPYDYHRANDIAPDEGFYLDVLNGKRVGEPPVTRKRLSEVAAPVYYELSSRKLDDETMVRITYWMLFGAERMPEPPQAAARAFEGDWRWVRVLLRQRTGTRQYVPLAVRYGPRSFYVPWHRIQAWTSGPRSTHPGVFVIRGSHGLLARPASFTTLFRVGTRRLRPRAVATACPHCIAWRSWRHLRRARDQRWYGFGGGWGEPLAQGMPSGMGPSRWTDVDQGPLGWPFARPRGSG